jgi:uncharacterized membrane protein (UPF0127 family)
MISLPEERDVADAYYRLCRADGEVVATRVERAATALPRMRGLLGRSALAEGEGIWLEPAPSIHTLFMRFAIDVLFLDRTGRILKAIPALRPWRFAAARGARVALELPAGTIARHGLAPGEVLQLEAAGE